MYSIQGHLELKVCNNKLNHLGWESCPRAKTTGLLSPHMFIDDLRKSTLHYTMYMYSLMWPSH